MTREPVRSTLVDDGVLLVAMDDEAEHNALTLVMVEALERAFAGLRHRHDVRAVVLAGRPDVFCSGASRTMLADLVQGRVAPSELLLPRLLLECPVPCLAAMAGHAIGGGFALGVAADLVLLAEESRYGLNFMDLGFTPGMGTTRLLEHVLSPAIAHELLFTAEARLGRWFGAHGGFNHVLPRDQVLAKAFDLAVRIAEKPRGALVALKASLSMPRRQAFELARTQEASMHAVSFAQPDVEKTIRASFLSP